MSRTTSGYFLIADITGYTQYLSESELEHAQQVLTALLELLVARTRPPLIISRLAGDAVISYGLRENFLQGQTFVEVIEECYAAFRAAVERMVLNNTCQCNACRNITNLDLKFFVHFGAFAIQRIRDHDELVGSDVNLIHRLLKNRVNEQTGFRAYTLYTDAAIQQLGLTEICATMTPHAERYEHLGEVKLWVQDMHPIWERKRSASRVTIPSDQVVMALTEDFALPPEQVWDYLSQVEFRRTLMNTHRHEVDNLSNGRIGPGSIYQCYHGDHPQSQTILEWQPFRRVVTQDVIRMPIPNVSILVEYRLEPIPTGTRFSQIFSKARGPLLGRWVCNIAMKGMAKQGLIDIQSFRDRIQADFAERQALPAATPAFDAEAFRAAALASLHAAHDHG